ncbi:5-hydroxytryptamine receptor 1A-like [Mizuhopecten yessoensis]|uniref:5-hydroxytryptamine receptor 1A-like n=1 Tax=Mizuhopecten yessoensis TaxID=6573 RepID=UPI000B45773C|nr:5-hydroxytryptamine receptor 1A-like [Mizuhopecten yessoensis]
MDIHRIEMVWLEMIDSSPVQKVPVACMCDDLFNGSLTIAEGSIQDVPRTEDQCIPFPDNIHEQIKQGVVSISTMLTQAKEETMDLCLVRIGFTIACCVSSIICLMCIAIERFVAITYSLTYRQIVTACRVSLVIFLSWLVALVVGFAPLIGWKIKTYHNYCSFLYVLPSDYIKFLFSSCVLLPILVTFTMYGLIYKYARRHIKRIEAIENLHLDRRNNRILRFSPRSMKSLKTLSAVFGCVLVTWLPFLLGTIVQVISGNTTCYLKDIVGTHLLLLGFTNSFLNPLIYAVGTKDFRDKVRDTFGRRTSCNSP